MRATGRYEIFSGITDKTLVTGDFLWCYSVLIILRPTALII